MWPKEFNLVSGSIHIILNMARIIIFIVFSPSDSSTQVLINVPQYTQEWEDTGKREAVSTVSGRGS